MRLFNKPDGTLDASDRLFLLTRRFDIDLTSPPPGSPTAFSKTNLSIRRRDGETPAPSAVSSVFRRVNLAFRRR